MAKKILVVEDSPVTSVMLKSLLEEEGYEVLTVTNGNEALVSVAREKPDLILLDIMLPGISGYNVCATLKSDRQYDDMPIIIVTSRAGEVDKKIGDCIKADAYITKPFEPEVLLSKIKQLLHN